MPKKKLHLEDLRVSSFITMLDADRQKRIGGGPAPQDSTTEEGGGSCGGMDSCPTCPREDCP